MKKLFAVLLMFFIVPVGYMAIGCEENEGGGDISSTPRWCVEQIGQWDVHQVENCRLEELDNTDQGGSERYSFECDDKGVAGTCPLTQNCGKVYKLKSVECTDELLITALHYKEEKLLQKTLILGPEDYLAAGENITDAEETIEDTYLGMTATYDIWVGCEGYDQTVVSSKYSVCIGGRVFTVNGGLSLPGDTSISCTCSGEISTFRNATVCTDFICSQDADPQAAGNVCPNATSPDGDLVEAELSSEDEL